VITIMNFQDPKNRKTVERFNKCYILKEDLISVSKLVN
jgi:hypothetical protein